MRKLTLLFVVGALSMPLAQAQGQEFSQLYIFGDSLSDVGNLATATGGLSPAPPFVDGRFSNGPVYVEVIAQELGLGAVAPVRRGGTNYAWGGAYSGEDRSELSGLLTIPSVRSQVADYLGSVGGTADPEALYIFYPGSSDVDSFLDAGLDANSGAAAVSGAVAAAAEALQSLVAAGAVKILVPSVPDMNSTPQHAGKPGATELSIQYNTELRVVINGINTLDIVLFDNFAFTNQARADYAVPDAACFDESTGSVCGDPENYLFFDDLHPTGPAHRSLGLTMLAALNDTPTVIASRSWGAVKAIMRVR